MDTNEIYKKLAYHHLDPDDEQEIAIQLWTKRDQYVASAGTLSTWIAASVKNYLISKARSKKEREINMQAPLSHFEHEDENGHTISSIDAYLVCKDSSALEQMIESENKQELLQRINSLDTIYADVLIAFIDGEYDASDSTQRARLSRAKDALVQNKRKERYKLIDLQAQQEFQCETLTQASEITGMTVEGIRWALNNSGFFLKKNWQISVF